MKLRIYFLISFTEYDFYYSFYINEYNLILRVFKVLNNRGMRVW